MKDTLFSDYEAAKKIEQDKIAAAKAEQDKIAAAKAEQDKIAKAKQDRFLRSKNAGRCNVELTPYGHEYRTAPYGFVRKA